MSDVTDINEYRARRSSLWERALRLVLANRTPAGRMHEVLTLMSEGLISEADARAIISHINGRGTSEPPDPAA